ncbi:MAG: flippase-like domain-containing protein [Saprospiraceae bacterium]|nr:flippase-like domain-containing protein [Saprospiraceae bacterium]MCF8249860.1 flippase-like domain-containing protein [Saprospiraceae bacterium]MCF8279470.1 flippase-like domain-containing protein [Bacteroidales bacterium]MCF8311706.1 flippase-like domain-containing protein [Saprospiraceae bacterium]MCF8440273.1 flippase-like domain-containing protein [Saprospiraceae bacterium]
MKKIVKSILQFLLFLGIGAVILYLVYRSQNTAYLADCAQRGIPNSECNLLEKLLNDFKSTNFGWMALVGLAFLVSNFSRTAKWQMLLEPLGYRTRFLNGYLSILVAYFANLGLPRMGEVVRAGILSKYENLPPEKVMGTIVVDRVVDVLCLGLVFLLAVLFEGQKLLNYNDFIGGNANTATVQEPNYTKWWVLGCILVVAVGMFLGRKKLANTAIFQKVLGMVKGFWEGIQSVAKLRNPLLFVIHSLNIWVMYFVMTWLGFQAFGPTAHLGLLAALTVFAFGTLGMVIPSPGGMGTFHFLVITALTTFYGIRGDDAFSVANIIFFTIQIGLTSMLGITALLLLPIYNKHYHPQPLQP